MRSLFVLVVVLVFSKFHFFGKLDASVNIRLALDKSFTISPSFHNIQLNEPIVHFESDWSKKITANKSNEKSAENIIQLPYEKTKINNEGKIKGKTTFY